jgi:hypothetical protein
MTMQTDVSSIHLNQSGFGYVGRTRVRGLTISCTATGGAVSIFDSLTAPVTTGTYARSGTTVTVTQTAHGLSTGDRVGIAFAVGTGGSATNGNYKITKVDANSFTLTDINTGSITGTPSCIYVYNVGPGNATQWHGSFDTAAAAAMTNITFPGEGFLIENALYITMTTTNVTGVTAFYG